MSTAATVAAVKPVRLSRKQLMSLLGLAPLTVYVFAHLWTNMYSMAGAEAFNTRLIASRTSPAFLFLEIFGLGLPIVAHVVAGVSEISHWRPNNAAYSFFGNLKFLLQRVTAIGVGLFLGAHIVKARILPGLGHCEGVACMQTSAGTMESWLGMHHAFSNPLTLSVYVLGTLGVCYHVANGLYNAAMRWGIVVSERGRARMQVVSAVVLVLMIAMAATAIAGFQPFQDVAE